MNESVEDQGVVENVVKEHIYISPGHAKYRLKYNKPDGVKTQLQFVKGEFRTTDPTIAAYLDNLIATSPAISSIVHKVDREAALILALAHKQQNVGVTGSMSSQSHGARVRAELDMRNAQLKDASTNPEAVETMNKELAAADLVLTHNTHIKETPIDVPEAKEVAPPAPPAPPVQKPAAPRQVFAALANKGK